MEGSFALMPLARITNPKAICISQNIAAIWVVMKGDYAIVPGCVLGFPYPDTTDVTVTDSIWAVVTTARVN